MIIEDNTNVEQGYFTHQQYWKQDHTERVVDQLLQEMAELQKELLKNRLGKGDWNEIVKEMADVLLCLEFLGRDAKISPNDMRYMLGDRAIGVHIRLTANAQEHGWWLLTRRVK